MWKVSLAALCLVYVVNAEKQKANAVLQNPDKKINGIVKFEETDNGVLVSGNITGLEPGKHGFHIHEKGDVSDPNCASAGPHFNPFNQSHGDLTDRYRHAGDFGNIDAAANENSTFSFIVQSLSFKGNSSIVGKIVVVHANADDRGRGQFPDSPTTGHSGEIIACGEIESAGAQHQTSMFLSFILLILVFFMRQ